MTYQNYYDEEELEIADKLPNHKWNTQTPNIVFYLGLDVYQLSVYSAISSFAFEGSRCIAGRKAVALRAGCSVDKLDECIKYLETTTHPLLNNKTLITVERNRLRKDDSPATNRICREDIWQENGDYFRNKEKIGCNE